MPRNSHTITRFKGISADSVANIPPDSAIWCNNVFADKGGWLNVFQVPTPLLDWSTEPITNLAAVLAISYLPIINSNPRLLIQQGANLLYADHPFSTAVKYSGGPLSGLLQRLDFATSNGITYFSNSQTGGYVLPPSSGTLQSARINAWGINPPTAPVVIPSTTSLGSVTIQRAAGVVTVQFGSNHGATVGGPVYVDKDPSATWDSSYSGVWKVASIISPTELTYAQTGLPDSGPYSRASFPGGLTATTGYLYGCCYGSSPVAHFSSLSAVSAITGPLTNQAPVVLLPPSTDPQVDEAALFRTQDGVDVQYLTNDGSGLTAIPTTTGIVSAVTTGPFVGYYVWLDTQTDESLAQSGLTAPYDNGVSPNPKYLSVWLDRILGCGMLSDPTGVRYTGFDSINFGRPQMCWCAFNEVKIGQGEAYPCGMGVLRYGGMVFFGTNGRMYIYRGTLNDITVSSPTSLSFYAEELPYRTGLYSHYSVQSTPAGLVWLDDGFNLRIFENSGFYPPRLLSPNLTQLFKRITPGSFDVIESAYINYLQRDWYLIAIPIDGSPTNNCLVVVDCNPDPNLNQGAFPTDYASNGLAWLQYADNSKHLITAMPYMPSADITSIAGILGEVPLIDNVNQGVTDQRNPYAANGPMPRASWRGGYFGIRDESGEDEFSLIKMFRYTRHSTNIGTGLQVNSYLVGEDADFDKPTYIISDESPDEPFVDGINVKGRALSLEVVFPDNAPAAPTLTTLMAAWVVTSER